MLVNNKIFFKIFKIMFLVIVLFISVFAVYSTQNQKEQILESFSLEAQSIAKMVSYLNSDSIVLDDGAYIVDFSTEFLSENKKIKELIFSNPYGKYYIIQNDSWKFQNSIDKKFLQMQKDSIKYEVLESSISNEKLFHYVYPIVFSGTKWGWLHLGISMDEYDKRIEAMYLEFIIFFISMLFTIFLISFIIAKTLSSPIVRLNKVANQISLGYLHLRSDYKSDDELGQLSDSFNKMISRIETSQEELKSSYEKLEDRVKDRTLELHETNAKLKKKSEELEELNKNLDSKVKIEVDKRTKNETLLIQQSRLAAMGEMIGNIAHQWRQPLSIISTASSGMKVEKQLGLSSLESEVEKLDLIVRTVNFLSNTIEDFSNFFKPNKAKSSFLMMEKVEESLNLIAASLKFYYIEVEKDIENEDKVYGFPNEFSQAVLNILSNAKDVLVQKRVENPKISIKVYHSEGNGFLEIADNAGGIDEKIIEKIFDPYFTTKHQSQGTGIGLYMSKMIIEQNMNGTLSVENGLDGAVFKISLPIL